MLFYILLCLLCLARLLNHEDKEKILIQMLNETMVTSDGGEMIRHIIFDLGNVLIEIHPEKVIKEFARHCQADSEDFKKFYLSELHLGFMGGRFNIEEFYQIMNKKFPCNLSPEKFYSIWELVIGNLKEGMQPIIEHLEKKYILSICSNTDPWHWNKAMREIPILKRFQNYFLSYEMKLNKPDARVFQYILTKLEASGPECLFIDDTLDNIKVAQNFGIHTIWSSDPSDIQKQLKTFQINLE